MGGEKVSIDGIELSCSAEITNQMQSIQFGVIDPLTELLESQQAGTPPPGGWLDLDSLASEDREQVEKILARKRSVA